MHMRLKEVKQKLKYFKILQSSSFLVGMLVQDPTRRGNHDIDSLFEQARQMGAQQGPFEHEPTSSSRSFTGTCRLLSGEPVPAAAPRPPESVIHNIYFWMNGFTVDDGPLRHFDDPANASFLESIRKSECPKELEPADERTAVNVNLRRMPENYTEPKKIASTAAFQGTGRTLGSGSSSSSTPTPSATLQPITSAPVIVDDSKISTSMQFHVMKKEFMHMDMNITKHHRGQSIWYQDSFIDDAELDE